MSNVPKKERFGLIYAIFWTALLVSLVMSSYLGLNSTFVWYLERQSYKMYETMLLGSMILLISVLVAGQLRTKRLLAKESALKDRLAVLDEIKGDDIDSERLIEEIERVGARRKGSWLVLSPLIIMAVLFIAFSAFAFAALSPYLVENPQINATFVLFAGSISKIAIGLESVVLFRFMVS